MENNDAVSENVQADATESVTEEPDTKKGDIVRINRHPDRSGKPAFFVGSTLKIIAVISMLIDHFGAAVVSPYLYLYLPRYGAEGCKEIITAKAAWLWSDRMGDAAFVNSMYITLREIGRIAFPIYCFLLVEGFFYSKNLIKYGLRLFLFFFISEIPFDLAFLGHLGFEHQNVFSTLLFGLIAMVLMEKVRVKIGTAKFINRVLWLLPGFAVAGVAEVLNTDYGAFGVIAIMILYMLRDTPGKQAAVGAASFVWEITAPLAFIPVYFYNGKRGLRMKYFFYVFYPLHLALLVLLRVSLFHADIMQLPFFTMLKEIVMMPEF